MNTQQQNDTQWFQTFPRLYELYELDPSNSRGEIKGSGVFLSALLEDLSDNPSLLDGSVLSSPSYHRR